MVISYACEHGYHGTCIMWGTCECICHRKDSPAAEEAQVKADTFTLRWEAHQAVKAFDLKPNRANATTAVQALNAYIAQLIQTDDEGPA